MPPSKDYERKPSSSEAQVYCEFRRLILRQITDNQVSYDIGNGKLTAYNNIETAS